MLFCVFCFTSGFSFSILFFNSICLCLVKTFAFVITIWMWFVAIVAIFSLFTLFTHKFSCLCFFSPLPVPRFCPRLYAFYSAPVPLSYQCKRKHRVKINAMRSDREDLNKGIPQGSILGPLIFHIFSNYIFYFVNMGCIYNYTNDIIYFMRNWDLLKKF